MRATVDGKELVRWPQKRFALEIGNNQKAGEAMYKMLRKKMQAAEELKQEMVAARAGRTTSAAGSAAASTPRGNPSSGARAPSAKARASGSRCDATPHVATAQTSCGSSCFFFFSSYYRYAWTSLYRVKVVTPTA